MTPEITTHRSATDRLVQFVELLMKSVRTGSLYAPDHPQRRASVGAVADALRAVVDKSGCLSLAVSPAGLQVQGVGLSSEESEDLARRISVGGLTYLELRETTTEDELSGLASLLALDLESLCMEDDLATLLWERQWPNVRWEAVEVPSAPVEDEPSTFNSTVPDRLPDDALLPSEWPAHEFVLTDAERSEVDERLREDDGELGAVKVAELLCRLIGLQRTLDHFVEELEMLRSVVDARLRVGEFSSAREILAMLAGARVDPRLVTEEKVRAIGECQASFASESGIAVLVQILERAEWDCPEAATTFLSELPHSAAAPLLDALVRLRNAEARSIVRRALSHHLRADLGVLQERFGDFQGDALIEIVRLVREISSKDAIPLLKEAILKGDVELRMEIVSTLEQIGGAHARAVLARTLSDPSSEVAVLAARALPGLGVKEALDPLLREMLRAEFRERPLEDRIQFFRAIGATNLPEVLPLLRKLLLQRGWWHRAAVREDRICATSALSIMSHPEANALRMEMLREGPKAVQDLLSEPMSTREAA